MEDVRHLLARFFAGSDLLEQGSGLEARAKAAARSRLALTVGSFANLNGGPTLNDVSDALQRNLMLGLSEDPEIAVRSQAAEAALPVAEVRFGVRFRLSGSLQRVGSGLRVDAKLVDVATGDHLWVEVYEGPDTPEFQQGITGLMVSQVRLNLMLGKFSLRDRAPLDSAEIRPIVNQAIMSFFQQTPASLRQAIELSERALAIDPMSVRARRTLAAAISASVTLGELPRVPENLERALALAHEVVAAVPHDEIARCEIAWALTNLGRHGEAAEHLRQAVDLNPAAPNARADLAEQLAILGEPREALKEVLEAFALSGFDPLEIWRYNTMAMALFALGLDAESLEVARHMVRVDPSFVRGAIFWAASAAAMELAEETVWAREHLLGIAPDFRRADLSPTYLTRYVKDIHQERLLEMLRQAGLP